MMLDKHQYVPEIEQKIKDSSQQAREVVTLFSASENSGKMTIKQVATAPGIGKKILDTDDCFILPDANTSRIYVWTGWTTSGRERNKAVKMAVNIKRAMGMTCKANVFPQGQEPQSFKEYFSDWDTSDYTRDTSDELIELMDDANRYAKASWRRGTVCVDSFALPKAGSRKNKKSADLSSMHAEFADLRQAHVSLSKKTSWHEMLGDVAEEIESTDDAVIISRTSSHHLSDGLLMMPALNETHETDEVFAQVTAENPSQQTGADGEKMVTITQQEYDSLKNATGENDTTAELQRLRKVEEKYKMFEQMYSALFKDMSDLYDKL